jgi:hypothetical protein
VQGKGGGCKVRVYRDGGWENTQGQRAPVAALNPGDSPALPPGLHNAAGHLQVRARTSGSQSRAVAQFAGTKGFGSHPAAHYTSARPR